MLAERKIGLERVENLMRDVHKVTTDMGIEVEIHKEKLVIVDKNVETAKDNVVDANDQLEEAVARAEATDKMMKYIFLCVFIFVIILLIFLFRK